MALTRTSRLLGCSSFLLLIGAWASCTSLEDIELGECGNSVLDPGEDCDGHEKNGAPCGEPGTPSACRYTCDFGSEEPVCPDADYRCGANDVCARAGAGFAAGAELPFGGESVVVADLVGDKIDDVGVASSTLRQLTVSFLGAGTVVELEQRLAIDTAQIAAAHLKAEDRADLVVASEGSLVSFSSPPSERLLVNNASTFIPADVTRLIGIPARVLPGEAAAAALQSDAVLGGVLVRDVPESNTDIYFLNPFDFIPRQVASVPGVLASEDVAAFFKARFYPVEDGADACDELILLRSDDNSLSVVPMCIDGVGVFENLACMEGGCVQTLQLGAAPVAAFPLNLDADPEVEIVVVLRDADGDVSLETFDGETLDPLPAAVGAEQWLEALLANTESATPPILAIDFINDDADLDFVRADGVYLSERLFEDPLADPTYFRAAVPSAGDWVEAIVGDFGGDQRPDVLGTARRLGDGIDVRLGTESSYMNGFTVPLAGAASLLTAGDFDGDGTEDVVFRERPDNSSSIPACTVTDSVVARFGARDSSVLADFRVLSRVSGVEDIVSGPLPRFDTRDSISDFATVSRCSVAPLDANISLFYGAVNRQILAPKVLIDDRDVGAGEQTIVPYTPEVIVPFSTSPFVAALGEDRFKVLPESADDIALFVLSPKDAGAVTGLLEGQSLALLGGEDHEGAAIADFRLAVTTLAPGETPAVVVVDPQHIHLIQAWSDLPASSDLEGAAPIESFPSVDMPGGDLAIDLAFGGDLTGDGADDLIVAGSRDGERVLNIHTDVGGSLAAVSDLSSLLEGRVLAAALLPREDLPGSQGAALDLVLAVENEGALVLRYDGAEFNVIQELDLRDIATVGVGDVDGDQFADLVLVTADKAQMFLRTQRYAGDEAATTEAGEQ